jgi:hypothetical protein
MTCMQIFARHGVPDAQTMPYLQLAWNWVRRFCRIFITCLCPLRRLGSEPSSFRPADRVASVWRLPARGSLAQPRDQLQSATGHDTVPHVANFGRNAGEFAADRKPANVDSQSVPKSTSDAEVAMQTLGSRDLTLGSALHVDAVQQGLLQDRVTSAVVVNFQSWEAANDAAVSVGHEKAATGPLETTHPTKLSSLMQ